jgi:hypothetical protein
MLINRILLNYILSSTIQINANNDITSKTMKVCIIQLNIEHFWKITFFIEE